MPLCEGRTTVCYFIALLPVDVICSIKINFIKKRFRVYLCSKLIPFTQAGSKYFIDSNVNYGILNWLPTDLRGNV